MRDQTPVQAGREKPVSTGEKITSICGKVSDQDSKPEHMNESGKPNY